MLFWNHCADQAAKFRAINNFNLQKKFFISANYTSTKYPDRAHMISKHPHKMSNI